MRTVMAGFVAAVVLLAPTASSPASLVGVGWLDGTVRRGPIVPVCVAGDPCDGPAVGVSVVIARGVTPVARVVTDAGGRFHRRLKPGLYIVRVASVPAPGRGSDPKTVRVRSGRHTSVRLFIDTGIR